MTERNRDLSEIKAVATFDNLPDPMIILDPKGIILYINPAALENIIHSSKDIIGSHFLEIGIIDGLTDEAKEQAKQSFNMALEKKSLPRAEYRFDIKDREPIYYLTNLSVIENSDGVVRFAVISMKNITNRMEMEKTLKQRQDELRVILDSAPAGIWYKDTKNNIIRVNKSGAASVGLTPADIEGKATAELFPEHAEKYFQDDLEVLESGEPKLGIIEPLITADGDTIWVKTDKIPTRDDSGKINGLIAIADDITDFKRIQEALEKSKNELEVIAKISDIFLTSSEDTMFADILNVVLDATNSEHGIFGYIDDNGALVCPSLTRDIWEQCQMQDKVVIFPRDSWGGIWGKSLIEKRTLLSNESFKVPKGHLRMNRALNVPIVYNNEVIGNLLIGNKKEDYKEYDVELLEKISEHLAPVLNGWLLRTRIEEDLRIKDQSIASAQNAIAIANLEGIVTYVNQSFLRMWGHDSHEAIIGKQFSSFSKNQKAIQLMMSKLMEKRHVQFETIATHTDGSQFDIEVSAQIVSSEDGSPISFMVSMTDISNRKGAEKESKLMNELMTGLSTISTERKTAEYVLQKAIQVEGIDAGGVYSHETETGAFVLLSHTGLSDDFVNQVSELGPDTPQAQLVRIGDPFYAPYVTETVPGVDGPQMEEGLKSIAIIPIKHEEEVLAVLNLASHTHSEIPERSRGFIESLALQLGEVFKRVMAVSALEELNLELEDRVIARTQELETERDKAQTYLELAEVVMVALDTDGIVTLVNRKGCEVLGCNAEEIVGKNWFNTFIPLESKDRIYGIFSEIISGKVEAVKYNENPILTAQDKTRIIAWNNTIIKDSEGQIIGTLSSGEDVTERKEAEVALRESEQRNRIIADGMSDLILIYDRDVRLREYYTADESMLYLPWEKMDGKRVEEFMRSDFCDVHYERVQQVKDSGENIVYEYDLEIGNTLRWFQGTMMLHEDKESIVVAVKEITERKLAEESIRQSEERYRDLYEEVRIGLLTTRVSDGKILDCNKRLIEMFGFENREHAITEGMAPERYTNPDQRQQIISELKESGFYDGELALTKIDETPIWVSVSSRLDLVVGTIETAFTDITERKNAREQIADAERRLRLSYDNAAIGMMWVETGGNFLRVNKAFSELVGYSEEELLEMTFQDVTHPEDYEIGSAIIERLVSGKTKRGSIEKRYIHKNGNVLHVRLNTAFIKNDVIGSGYFFTQAEDITEAKMASWSLEERMKERNCLLAISELANERGRNCGELLEQAVHVLPSGWQYPDNTCARIQFEEFETATSNFNETEWKQSAEIITFGESSGIIEVYYLEEKPLMDEGPFQKEERELIDAIAARLATSIERNRAEIALQVSQERLEAFMDSATDSMMVYDSSFTMVMLNSAAKKLLAPVIGETDPVGKHILELSPTLEERGRYAEFLDVMKTGKSFIADDYIPSPILGDIYLNLRAFKVGDGLGMITTNVTERRIIDAALAKSEERFRSSFEESLISMEILDTDGIVTGVNQACLDMFGISNPEDIIGFNLFDDPNIPIEHKERMRNNESLREDYSFSFELIKQAKFYKTKKTGMLNLRTTITPLGVKSDGTRDGFLVQMVDVTDRVVAEKKLQDLNEELENIVDERTKALRDAQEELVKKERLATLGQISGGVGHELRNPLAAIKNSAYFLRMMMETQNSEIDETLEILDKEVDNCERIISSLLDFARPKSPTLQKIAINDVLLEVLKRIEIPDNIKVQNKHSGKLPIILGDLHQLERVFLNLITNAIQAMVDGGTLTLRTKSDDAGHILVFIEDTGVGIPEENMGKLFEPLFTTKAKGIGLGLSIVKSLVSSHKGEITAESKVGKGTKFKIKLPTSDMEVR